MKSVRIVVISIIITCSCGCRTTSHVDDRYPVHQYQTYESGPILSEKEWVAKFHTELASRRWLPRPTYEMLEQEYNQYVRLKLANRDYELKRRETDANIRLIEAQTKLLEAETHNDTVKDIIEPK